VNLPKAKTPHEREAIERTIAATEKPTDQLVYELYGWTEQKIRVWGVKDDGLAHLYWRVSTFV